MAESSFSDRVAEVAFCVFAGLCLLAAAGIAFAIVVAAGTTAVSYADCEMHPTSPRCVAVAERDAANESRRGF